MLGPAAEALEERVGGRWTLLLFESGENGAERFGDVGRRLSIATSKGNVLARIAPKHAGTGIGEFVAPHGVAVDSRGDFYVAEVSWTAQGKDENPPREIRSLQKFERL